jgi:hypothetical protein
MIVEWLFTGVLQALSAVVGALLPDDPLPGFMTDFSGQLAGIFRAINGLGAWAPFAYAGIVLTTCWGVYGVCFLVKLGLRAASHSPVSGGAG